MQIAPVGCDLL